MSWEKVCLTTATIMFAASAVIDVSATTALSIVTSAMSKGQQGAAYAEAISAKGGTSPYKWSLTSGTLPAAVALNATTGVLTGTPSQSGAFTFTVNVFDTSTSPRKAQKALTLQLAPPPLPVLNNILPDKNRVTACKL